MLRYLIFVIFGILLFVFLNHKDGFSIGIPIWLIPVNADASGDRPRILATDPSIQLPLLSAGGGNEEENLRLQVDDFLRTPYATDDRGRVVGGRGHYEIYTAPCERVPPGLRGGDFEVAGSLDLVEQSNIHKLFKGVCLRVDKLITYQAIGVLQVRLLNRKIIEAILDFIGESGDSRDIIIDMRQRRDRMRVTARLDSHACAAFIINCLDISDISVIPLDILFDLLELIFNHLISEGELIDDIIEIIFVNLDPTIPAPIHVIIRLAQAIIKFQQRNVIAIDPNFIQYFFENWVYVDGESGITPIPNSINIYYQFLWIYTAQVVPINLRSFIPELSEWPEDTRITFSNFASIVTEVYYKLDGQEPCDDSGD